MTKQSILSSAPAWFRAACQCAAQVGSQSYFGAGYELARHLQELLKDEPDTDDKLDELSKLVLPVLPGTALIWGELREDNLVWAWFWRELPACMKLVPVRRRKQFVAGVFAAVDDDVVF